MNPTNFTSPARQNVAVTGDSPRFADKGLWRRLRRGAKGDGYFFNHKALPPDLPEKWAVDCKRVGNGEKALVYLGEHDHWS